MGRFNEYKQARNYENLQKAMYAGAGEYDIPQLSPVTELDVSEWISFNYANGHKESENTGVHFFIDDYQFERVWRQPNTYAPMLARFNAVCTPDFSQCGDYPKAIQIYNHYRKHWCGAYWQEHGIKVIPTIRWSSPESLEWAFDGEPVGGIVAVTSVGCLGDDISKRWFLDGYAEMIEWLQPTKILWKGMVPDELAADKESGLIFQIRQHNDKWHVFNDD